MRSRTTFAFLDGAPEELPEPVEAGLDLGFRTAPIARPADLRLRGARVVTMRDAEARQEVIDDGVVIIEDNRIQAVGASGDVASRPTP